MYLKNHGRNIEWYLDSKKVFFLFYLTISRSVEKSLNWEFLYCQSNKYWNCDVGLILDRKFYCYYERLLDQKKVSRVSVVYWDRLDTERVPCDQWIPNEGGQGLRDRVTEYRSHTDLLYSFKKINGSTLHVSSSIEVTCLCTGSRCSLFNKKRKGDQVLRRRFVKLHTCTIDTRWFGRTSGFDLLWGRRTRRKSSRIVSSETYVSGPDFRFGTKEVNDRFPGDGEKVVIPPLLLLWTVESPTVFRVYL